MISTTQLVISLLFLGYIETRISSSSDVNETRTNRRQHQMRQQDRYYNLLEALQTVINDQKANIKTSNVGVALWDRQDLVDNYPKKHVRHCDDILAAGNQKSGVYLLNLPGGGNLKVFCDMETEGGGWTVFQRRINGKVDFYRDWLEYRRGFGDVDGEYWLGLDNIHLLTHTSPMELYIHIEDFEDNARYAHYDSFAVSSEFSRFTLDIGSYRGNARDSLDAHRGMKFSTKDRDYDTHGTVHCATSYNGAWWYEGCYQSNLNGVYQSGGQRTDHQGIQWRKWKDKYSFKSVKMMMRPAYRND